ncbi:MAG: ABC transporter substrate-binding protein [Anaerolineae bacterium]
MKTTSLYILILVAVVGLLSGCGGAAPAAEPAAPGTELIPVTLMLDWVPNTNHTGIFVAQQKGYFTEQGLDVAIIQPGEVYAEAAVASGVADFGISFQEAVTLARAEDTPIVSVAAVIQSNTSGFAAPAELGVETPADFEGLRYGSFGSPFEAPTLEVLMRCAGADFTQLEIVDTGFADPLALLAEGQIDLAWIFYGWQGFQAEQQGIPLDYVMLSDYFDCIPDYYTPVVITNEELLASRPEVGRAFMKALSQGYEFAIENPAEAAAILLEAVPELDADLVNASQGWLSPRYRGDAPRWGEQKLSIWQGYTDWMVENGILTEPIDVEAAFTNDLLP